MYLFHFRTKDKKTAHPIVFRNIIKKKLEWSFAPQQKDVTKTSLLIFIDNIFWVTSKVRCRRYKPSRRGLEIQKTDVHTLTWVNRGDDSAPYVSLTIIRISTVWFSAGFPWGSWNFWEMGFPVKMCKRVKQNKLNLLVQRGFKWKFVFHPSYN